MKHHKGFTLIELLIVMALLAILLGIGASTFMTSIKKGRDNTRKNNLRAIASALEMYYNDKGKYPFSMLGTDGYIQGCYNASGATGQCGKGDFTIWKDSVAGGAMWMAKFPTDPISTQRYYYVSVSGTQFQMYAHLENDQDPAIITPAPNMGGALDCGDKMPCNYGVSSANTNP